MSISSLLHNNKNALLFLLVLSVVIAVLFYPAINGEFISDDHTYIRTNAALKGLDITDFYQLLRGGTNPYEYLPIRDLSLWADMQLFGDNPSGFHVHNILLYILCCIFVYSACRLLWPLLFVAHQAKANLFAIVTTTLFALHPAHVESVAWISGRKDLLSGLFSVLTVFCFAKSLCSKKLRISNISLAAICFLFAIFSKSSVITLPAFLFLLAFSLYSRERNKRDSLLGSLIAVTPFFIIGVVGYILIANMGQQTSIKLDISASHPSVFDDQFNRASLILGTSARIALFPLNLRLHYDVYDESFVILSHLLSIITIILAVLGVVLILTRRSLVLIGAIFFFLLLLPYLQIIPFGTWSLASERFLFFPLLGFVVSIAGILVVVNKKPIWLAFIISLPLCAMVVWDRTKDWKSEEALFTANADTSDYAYAQFRYINSILMPRQQYDLAHKAVSRVKDKSVNQIFMTYVELDEVWAQYQPWMPLKDVNEPLIRLQIQMKQWAKQPVFHDLPKLLLYNNLYGEMKKYYRTLISMKPKEGILNYNYGNFLKHHGEYAEAAEQISVAIQRQSIPNALLGSAWNNLGLVHRQAGDRNSAMKAFERAIDVDPNEWKAVYRLAELQKDGGDRNRFLETVELFKKRAEAAGRPKEKVNEAVEKLLD